jgi:hypothetical protein
MFGMAARKVNPLKLREFRGIKPEHLQKLEMLKIKTAGQMLSAGGTRKKRNALAKESGIPSSAILELVKLSDLSRLPGVKGIRARLYYDAGVDTVEKMAGWDPDKLLREMSQYVKPTGFDGIAPLPREVSSTIANARKLEKVVEW